MEGLGIKLPSLFLKDEVHHPGVAILFQIGFNQFGSHESHYRLCFSGQLPHSLELVSHDDEIT